MGMLRDAICENKDFINHFLKNILANDYKVEKLKLIDHVDERDDSLIKVSFKIGKNQSIAMDIKVYDLLQENFNISTISIKYETLYEKISVEDIKSEWIDIGICKQIVKAITSNKIYQYGEEEHRKYALTKTTSVLSDLTRQGDLKWEYTKKDHVGKYGCILGYKAEYADNNYYFHALDDLSQIEKIAREIDPKSDTVLYEKDFLNFCRPHIKIETGGYYECITYKFDYELINLIYNKKHIIKIKDAMVRTDNLKCVQNDHSLRRIDAIVGVIDDVTHRCVETKIDVYYCEICNRYYITEQTFIRLKNRGYICCRIIDIKELNPQNKYSSWAEESTLKQYGYTVDSKANLSQEKRLSILSLIIDCEIMTKTRIIEFLSWLIAQNSNRKNMEKVVGKWRDDIKELQADYFDLGLRKVKIETIFLK